MNLKKMINEFKTLNFKFKDRFYEFKYEFLNLKVYY